MSGQPMGWLFTSILWLSLVTMGCGGPSDGDGDADLDGAFDGDGEEDGDLDAPAEAECDGAGLRVLRINPWPGGGLQLFAELRAEGFPAPESDLSAVTLRADGGPAISRQATRWAGESTGITAVILVPSADPEVMGARVAGTEALIRARPEGERIGLWRAGDELELMAELTTRRSHVLERLTSFPSGEAGETDDGDLDDLVATIAEVEGPTDSPSRFIVVVGDPEERLGISPFMAAVLRLDGSAEGLDPGEDRAGWGGGRSPADAARDLAGHLDRLRAAVAVVGACDLPEGGDALEVTFGDTSCIVEVPEPLGAMADIACDPEAAAAAEYPFGETVDIELTDHELETWNRYDEERSEADFTLHVRLGESAPIKATGHFRGQTSMECARKSVSVDLEGTDRYPLAPRSTANELFLVSMCKDGGYYQQLLANRLMRRMDLFPLEFRVVELRVNGESRGAYLLLEKPTHTLRRSLTDVDRVIRRRTGHDFDVEAELEHPDATSPEEETELLAEFLSLGALVDTTAPEMLWDVMSQRLDFEAYLRWMAFNTFLRNGDYVDETLFYASTELSGGGRGLYFRNMGWDHDDLNSTCHHQSRYALEDPWGIVYCAEDEIDLALVVSDDTYSRFIDILEEVMDERITGEVLEAELERVREELFTVLDSDDACGAMVELGDSVPADPTCDDVQAEISRRTEGFLEAIAARRTELAALIDDWRSRR